MGILEIKHLKMVQTIVERGNMTRAARALFLSQSALSQQLKDIETKLGTRLFHRTRKQMLLTPMGKKIRDAAEAVIQSLEETEADIARIVNGEAGELKVGTQCIYCYRWLPGVMKVFQEKFPQVDLLIGHSADAARELSTNAYDLVIMVKTESADEAEIIPLFRDEMMAILPPDHPLTRKPHLELTDFQDENYISTRPAPMNWFYQQFLKPRGISPGRLMTVEDPYAVVEMVAAGFGMAMTPRWAIRSHLESGRIRAATVTRPGLFLTWQAMFLKSDPTPVFLREFIRLVGFAGIAGYPKTAPVVRRPS
jgi:LysR family transcriptional regulator for metE and metH